MKCVVIAGGGTGGHLFPGIAVAEELRRRHPEVAIHFVGTPAGIEVRAVPKTGFGLSLLNVVPLRGGGVKQLLRGFLSVPKALWQSIKLIRKLKPDVVLGVGGYASGPAVLAAYLCRVPTIILEQNAAPGLTTRLLAPFVRRICAALPSPMLKGPRVTVVGNPIRAAFGHARDSTFVLPSDTLHLLVFGGSLGAHALNNVVVPAVQAIRAAGVSVDVIHQTGRGAFEKVCATTEASGVSGIRVVDFIDNMAEALSWSHLVVCRAGAGSIAELGTIGRPSILVPFPHASDDHQHANAKAWETLGAAICLPQGNLTAETLASQVVALVRDPDQMSRMAYAAKSSGKPDAAEAVVHVIEDLCRGGS